MTDKAIIAMFEQRNEQGIAEANRAYGGLLQTIAMHILRDSRDAEECVNDTLLNAWNSIPPKKPVFFSAYLAKLTRNLALNRYAEEHTLKRGGGEVPAVLDELAECIPSQSDTEQVNCPSAKIRFGAHCGGHAKSCAYFWKRRNSYEKC